MGLLLTQLELKSQRRAVPFYWAIPEKSKQEELGIYNFFEPLPPRNFSLFYFNPGNCRQNKVLTTEYLFHKVKTVLARSLLKISTPQKQRPLLEIPHYFFLVTLGNSASFLINPWKFHVLFI